MTEENQLDADSPWKEILEEYFPQFMSFFALKAYQEIDWEKGYEFLDKEFQKIFPESSTGRRYVDKLVKVYTKEGTEAYVIIHIEVQGDQVSDFEERMYIYNYRLFDYYRTRVMSLAVLTDNNPNWRPNKFELELWGCRVALEYPMLKLLDFADRWEELQESTNPFAVVVMAHLKTLETSGDEHLRMQWKLNLVKMLYYKGYSRQDIRNLFKFIDWLLMLPKGLEKEFKNELVNFEEEQKMPYVTSIERIGREEGREEGKEEGREEGKEEGREEGREEGALLNKQNILLRLLSQKFGLTNKESELISKQEDPQLLDKALDEVLFAESKEEVLKHLK